MDNSNNDNNSGSCDNNSGRSVENDIFDHFYQNIRRFTDRHISSLLHSLIGLPSILSPPAGQTWVIIDDLNSGSDVNSLGWKKERVYSDGEGQLDSQTMQEIHELKASWTAQRATNGVEGGGGGSGIVVAEGEKIKEQSTSPSSEPSSTSSGPLRTVHVFRFPSSSFRYGYSDFYSPDADRLEWTKKHMIRSLHAGENSPFGFPRCFVGSLQSFMFSPFAGLFWNYVYHDPFDRVLNELEFQRRMRNALFACRKICYYEDEIKNESSTKSWVEGNSEPSPILQPSFAAQDGKEEAISDPEAELELYEHFESMKPTSPTNSLVVGRRPASSRVLGSSISTQSRTLPDGSRWTKTVKITRFDDGRQERIEEEHSNPSITNYCNRTPSDDRGPSPQMGEKNLKDGGQSNICSPNGNGEVGLYTRSARQDLISNEILWARGILKKPDGGHDEEPLSSGDDTLRDATNPSLNEAKRQHGWGWFWKQ